jgi:NAD(P)-dependent dehydrogenase (short-subunit alcohol dehydrogenase family)
VASTAPGIPGDLVTALLDGDEERAGHRADVAGADAAYAASKLALARWARRAAPGWMGAGIRLNVIAPGLVRTPMVAEMERDPAGAALVARYPSPRGGAVEPAEVASVAAFLLGPDAAAVAGAVLPVDGGTEALLRADDWPRSRPAPARR